MGMIPQEVLQAYGFGKNEIFQQSFGTGLINHTWKLTSAKDDFIVQTINQNVFPNPEIIAANIDGIANYLKLREPEYFFVSPMLTISGDSMFYFENKYYRVFPFVKDSHAKTVVNNASEAFEAARQFGMFTKLLSKYPISELKVTLVDFHNLSLRYSQFEEALKNGNTTRIEESQPLIQQIQEQKNIVALFEQIQQNPDFKIRVTHHDTKISNVLFDPLNQGICVIDLDTVMPGLFISDVGDMMRTYLCPVSEEEKDLSKITIRSEIYKAIVNGYEMAMGEELTAIEKEYFFYAGQFMIYMQALRFLTDHLNMDRYYGARYEGHNFIRAANQLKLLEVLINLETELK